MKKIISGILFFVLLAVNTIHITQAVPTLVGGVAPSVDLLKDGITENNAGLVLQKKIFTNGDIDISNLKFTIVNGAKLSLASNIKNSFEVATKTRAKYNLAKSNPSFKAIAKMEDTIIEYPDRVRIITKTEYSYNSKVEYDSIFSGALNNESVDATKVQTFLSKHPEFSKYSNGIGKANKKDILEKLTEKVYAQCLVQNRTNPSGCKTSTIKNNVENLLNNYKGKRTLTETIDVNKIPMVYDADRSIDFTQRLKDSNISKEPSEVRLSALQIKNSFLQYSQLSPGLGVSSPALSTLSPTNKSCAGLGVNEKIKCEVELAKLNANNTGTNPSISYSGTLLNGFTLGESYSYKLGDSYSIAGFTVYDIGVSFYAGYGAGIRIPMDVNITLDKDRLEKGVGEDFNLSIKADTKDKDAAWFRQALGSEKAFDGKEAVLEAGAYARGKIVLLEKTVFNEQIGGKYDWGNNRKMPVGDEKKEIFSETVEGQDIGLEVILYGVHISGDLKATGTIKGDITYECRSVYATGTTGDATKCKDIFDTKLKDSDVADIEFQKNGNDGLVSNLSLRANPDKYYYKNPLGVYNKFGVSLNTFKYKPELEIDLFLRGKVGVDTGDYFGWFWLETPWLKVYTFDIDLPTLRAHDGYNPKRFDIYEQNYIYNFSKTSQDTNTAIDSSVACTNYSPLSEKNYKIGAQKFSIPRSSSNTFIAETDYPRYYNYNYGGNIFYKNDGSLVYQDFIKYPANTTSYYHIKSIPTDGNYSHFKYGHTRETTNSPYDDYKDNKVSEMQFVENNKVYYYSQATNTLFTGDINTKKVAYNPVPEMKDITTYKELKSSKKPIKNTFTDMFGSADDYSNITNYMGPYTFKKFNFAFSDNFTSNKLFAYIGTNSTTKKPSIQIYKNKSFYKEISEDDLEYNTVNPVYIQFSGKDLLVLSKDVNNATGEQTYTLYEYNYQDEGNPFVLESSLDKKKFTLTGREIVTGFAYNKAKKTMFVSYLEKTGGARMIPEIKSVRFNGNNNAAYEKVIYTTALTKEEYISRYDATDFDLDYISEGQEAQTYITNIQLGKEDNSLLLSLNHSFFYDDGMFRHHFVIDEIKELSLSASEGQKDTNGQCSTGTTPPPAPTTMNMGPQNQSGSGTTIPTSTDEYVNEKLSEIQSCFAESYSEHLTNINNAIDKLIAEKDKQTDDKAKAKYDRAIAKMEEIKKIFMARYASILRINK